MADIVQLEEKGNLLYPKTHTSAIDGLEESLNSLYENKTEKTRQKWRDGLNWIAHRGNNTEYPENSILAFKNANRHWGIEADIQITSDGYWVVMHDDTVDRMTDGTGPVNSKTLAQFRSLRIDSGANISTLSDSEKIPPTLEEYLTICKDKRKVPVIEVKAGTYTNKNYELLRTILTNHGYNDTNCVITSFDYNVLISIRKMYPDIELHFITSTLNQMVIDKVIYLGQPATLGVKYNTESVNSELVNQLHSLGIKINVWTVPENKFTDMKKLNIDYITTDSLSGNLRYSALALQNDFTNTTDSGRIKESYVEELEGGVVHLTLNVSDGVKVQNSIIALLPEWAIPMYRQYGVCSIRVSNGVEFGTFDINGRLAPASASTGSVGVGLNWTNKTTWAAGSITYKI